MTERELLIQRMIGRAKFCRDRGEVKTPELLEQAVGFLLVDKGYKLVPVEPTEEMYFAGTHELTQIDFRDLHDNDSVAVYKAMISACE